MKQLIFALGLLLLSSSVIAEACDYEIFILADNSSVSFRIRAINNEGPPSNTSTILQVTDLDGKLMKEYHPWNDEKITKQRTSNSYTPNIEAGKYKVSAKLEISCQDSRASNNIAFVDFEVKGQDSGNDNKAGEIVAQDSSNYSNVVSLNPKIQGNAISEEKSMLSSSEKSKGLIVLFILIASVALNAVLIWKR